MTCEEKDKMKTLNQKYKDKFGFPFVICARLNKKEAILKGLELRCYNSLQVSMTSVVEHSEIQCLAQKFDVPYARHYNPLLIINHGFYTKKLKNFV